MTDRITIGDIAAAAGVSKTTVSRYLNRNYSFMSAKTKEKIAEIIQRENYIPNNIARSLKSKESHMIGVITHSLRNQMGALTIASVNDVCAANGYGTIVCCSNNDPSEELKLIQFCQNQQVDGIILIPAVDDKARYETFVKQGTPIELVNRPVRGWQYGSVYVNHKKLITQMLKHLHEQGYEKVLLINDGMSYMKQQMVTEFAKQAKAMFGMKKEESTCQYTQGKEAQKQIEQLLLDFFDREAGFSKAVFAINTPTLLFVLKTLDKHSLYSSQDLGVCGYDALGWSQLVDGGITSIKQPMDIVGTRGAEELIRIIQDKTYQPKKVVLEGTIYYRKSTER